MKSTTRIVIVGAKGRMGQAIVNAARHNSDYEIISEVDMGDNLSSTLHKADVVIDFSHHTATLQVAETVARASKALVIGTTGHSDADKKSILEVKSKIPVILSSNYSVGVNLLFFLTKKTAEILGDSYDQEIVELHHRLKKDAPSGTAKSLAEILCAVRDLNYESQIRHGRTGEPGARTNQEIGVHALRGGDIVGEHTVYFAGMGERIELTHKASSRDTFALGALRAAKWLVGKQAGSYNMFDVLGLPY